MRLVLKKIGVMTLVLAIMFCVNTTTKAQSPADDPGIGGPGSPTVGVGSDSGPVVPLDRDLSIMLIAAGMAYGYKKVKQAQALGFN